MFANGKRTAGDIASLLERRLAVSIEIRRLEGIFKFLGKLGVVALRPYLTQEEVKAALTEVGVEQGDVLLGHFALNWFGYIEGGAESLIDTLLELLGPEGTLVMPTFSFSWLGRAPFDPGTTPSRVGAVTNCFWRRPGVKRSAHPTHSFAAFGKHAPTILAGHNHTQSPLSEDGPLGRLEALGGKILMFAPPNSNTSMHVGEWRAGIPLLELICPIIENGERREVLVPDCPWHVAFELAYERLYARSQVREAVLGEQTIRVMLCKDAIAAQEETMREAPEAMLQPGCDCAYCNRLLEHCNYTHERRGLVGQYSDHSF